MIPFFRSVQRENMKKKCKVERTRGKGANVSIGAGEVHLVALFIALFESLINSHD